MCNSCETNWNGELFLKYEELDKIHLTTKLKIFSNEKKDYSDLKWKVPSETDFYEISVDNGSINLFPRVNKAIQHYLKQKDFSKSKIEVYKSFLESINSKDVPKDKISELLDGLVKKEDSSKRTYTNKLAQSLESSKLTKYKKIYTESALTAALIILNHYNKEAAFEIVDMSGLSSKEEFIEELKFHDWFFNPEEDSKDSKGFKGLRGLCGIIGGPNYFLNKLKDD